MNAAWAIPIGGAATVVFSAAAVHATIPDVAGGDWIATLAAMGGIVTVISSGVNAFFNRSIKLAIMERVDAVKAELLKSVDTKLDRLAVDLARKDLTDERFRSLERRTLLLEKTDRDEIHRAHRTERDDE